MVAADQDVVPQDKARDTTSAVVIVGCERQLGALRAAQRNL
jgi:hypothetical protein